MIRQAVFPTAKEISWGWGGPSSSPDGHQIKDDGELLKHLERGVKILILHKVAIWPIGLMEVHCPWSAKTQILDEGPECTLLAGLGIIMIRRL